LLRLIRDKTYITIERRIKPVITMSKKIRGDKRKEIYETIKKAKEIYESLKPHFTVQYDETGSIGRRYRRMDEVGTLFCLTVDFDSSKKDDVTLRYRDTMKQERVKIDKLVETVSKNLRDQ